MFKGYNLKTNSIIAVKRMKKSPEKENFHRRELKTMEELEKIKHDNIVGYYGFFEDDMYYYLMLEYCMGTLRKIIAEVIPEQKVVSYIKQIFSAMCYLHDRSTYWLSEEIMHRDLKPDNILLD